MIIILSLKNCYILIIHWNLTNTPTQLEIKTIRFIQVIDNEEGELCPTYPNKMAYFLGYQDVYEDTEEEAEQ